DGGATYTPDPDGCRHGRNRATCADGPGCLSGADAAAIRPGDPQLPGDVGEAGTGREEAVAKGEGPHLVPGKALQCSDGLAGGGDAGEPDGLRCGEERGQAAGRGCRLAEVCGRV